MDLTPQVINEVEFSMARRGYDPDQVDEFLEKVAVAVGELNARLADLQGRVGEAERRAADAERRAEEAERKVAEAGAELSAEAEAELETLKRTLVLAQRTADAAVREAQEEARRLVAKAESDAREAHEATRRAVLEEIARLEASRDGLRAEVDALERHLAGQRSRLQGAIDDLQRILDEPTRFAPSEPAVAAPGEALAAGTAAAASPAEQPAEAQQPAPPGGREAAAEERPRIVTAEEAGRGDDAWARFGEEEVSGPPTQPVLRLDRVEQAGGGGDDAYLSELRKAMLSDTGAPDVADAGIDTADIGRAARTGRFGRRR